MVTRAITSLKAQTRELEARIFELGRMAEASISRAITALLQRDTMLASSIIRDDAEIDRAEVEVQEHCLRILEECRPRGADLRLVIAILKINDNLERIGDLSENVAEVVVEVGDWERFRQVPGIRELAEQAHSMV